MQGIIVGPAVFNNLDVIPSVSHEDDGERSLIRVATVSASSSNSNTGACVKFGTYVSSTVDLRFLFASQAQHC